MTEQELKAAGLDTFQVMVLREIDETKTAIHELTREVGKLKVNQREIKIKSSLWGALSAVIVTLGAFALRYIPIK